jgi:hypothetical protein
MPAAKIAALGSIMLAPRAALHAHPGSVNPKTAPRPLQPARPIDADTPPRRTDGRVNQPLTEVVFL